MATLSQCTIDMREPGRCCRLLPGRRHGALDPEAGTLDRAPALNVRAAVAIPFKNTRRRIGPLRAMDFDLATSVDVTGARKPFTQLTMIAGNAIRRDQLCCAENFSIALPIPRAGSHGLRREASLDGQGVPRSQVVRYTYIACFEPATQTGRQKKCLGVDFSVRKITWLFHRMNLVRHLKGFSKRCLRWLPQRNLCFVGVCESTSRESRINSPL